MDHPKTVAEYPASTTQLFAKLLAIRTDVESKRYVGAQIGIYNPRGQRVGRVSHLRNQEHLFVVGPDRARIAAVIQAVAASGSSAAVGAASAVAASRPAA